jgi:predicted dehydrogenase
MTDRLRIVQVGLGGWGRDWAWRINPTIEEVQVVGYVDSDPSALALLHKRLPASRGQGFATLEEAIVATRPDALLVTTTIAGHAPLARAGLEAGLHVLVEKPFTDTLEKAAELVALAEAKGLVLMVSQNYRFFPASRTAAQLVREGDLGDLHRISIDFRRDYSTPPKPRFRLHADPQPLLVDMSIHHFDLLRLICGRQPDRIFCATANAGAGGFDGPPTAAATIFFGDVLVSYRGSWTSAAPKTAWAGEWNMEFAKGHVYWTSRGDNGLLSDKVAITPRRGKRRTVELPTLPDVDRAGTLREFATALLEGREPETSGRDNLMTLAFTLAVVESSERQAWVELKQAFASSWARIR